MVDRVKGPFRFRRARTVRGHHLPPPRPTVWALWYALVWFGLPLVAVLALLDLVLWWLFTEVLGLCYGIFCLFG